MASLTHKIFASLKAGGEAALTPAPSAQKANAESASPASSSSPSSAWKERFYHVAVQGCCHGELDRIYDECAAHERQSGKRIDVLICCGDFQAVRTASDMDSMAVPDKFKVMGDFHKYWSAGASSSSSSKSATAPYLTIFVGGNHENSDLLAQESYGGFVAPNIYYLGHSGVVTVDNCLRVAGLSGIFKDQDYDRPYPPRPYAANYGWKKGAYHVRRVEVAKLHAYLRTAQALQHQTDAHDQSVGQPLVDIFVSHDWPVGITAYGDEAQLLRFKPYFRDDIRRHALGNPHTMNLLREAKPGYWVAAHLHCLFEATVSHTLARSVNVLGSGDGTASQAPTKFVALDKCAKGSGFLTFLDLPRHPRGAAADTHHAASTSVSIGAGRLDMDGVLGAARIQRDPVWLEVLLASHAHVAENRTTESGSDGEHATSHGPGGQRGFDVGETVRTLLGRRTTGSTKRDLPFAAAQMAPTTKALLRELHLSPALPLQQQQQQDTSAPMANAATGHAGQSRQTPTSWAPPRADGPREGMRYSQRPRTEVASVQPQTAAPSFRSSNPAPAAPLSFFEDVGTATQSVASVPPPPSASSSCAALKDSKPEPLGWFEDTAS